MDAGGQRCHVAIIGGEAMYPAAVGCRAGQAYPVRDIDLATMSYSPPLEPLRCAVHFRIHSLCAVLTGRCRALLLLIALALVAPAVFAAGGRESAGDSNALPPAVSAALARAGVPAQAFAAVVVPADDKADARLRWRAMEPMNPASVMKLTTTFAALDLLGPSYTWGTPVFADGPVRGGTLQGNLYLRGSGDPTLVMEQLWLLLRRVQARGIQTISGDIVIDGSAFTLAPQDAGAFDGEPLRPYNAAPEALLVNFKALVLSIVPDAAAGVARIQAAPPLAGFAWPATVPLAPPGTACGDWRARMQLNMAQPAQIAFDGSFPATCGERTWSIAPPEPELFTPRAVAGLWAQMGGRLSGTARRGAVPGGLAPLFVHTSAPLADAVQSVNKFSNNVMAQQIFLTFGVERGNAGDPDAARQAMQAWWAQRVGGAHPPDFDNGAGLSRESRISADALARMLQRAWASPVMPELLSSLPIVGVDGTLRRSKSRAVGNGHLKTGSLRDVVALAGYVLAADGQRWVLVAFVNHANAAAARPALDALVDWTAGQNGR